MLEAGFEFDGAADHVLTALAGLPLPLRPTHFSHEEKVGSDADRIADRKRFAAFVAKSKSGFFLLGPAVTYSIRIASGRPLVCDCFMDVEPETAKQLLEHMSTARPIFGFACAPGERERRNRVTTRQGVNTIESWVGRDTQKYLPGFYWLTLLPEALAKQHGVPLIAVKAVAQEHIELEGGQHLFRFYERPGDWVGARAVTELGKSLPGVFDVEKVKPKLLEAKNFLELNSMLRDWK
ncbi:hypothetical protein [Roseateles sp. MS654]|uniref:hypothetical protein n=1 Tax=Roseateles sp. MS654 TaxID=3412685 RepID=UPI003C2DA94F